VSESRIVDKLTYEKEVYRLVAIDRLNDFISHGGTIGRIKELAERSY
jgi:hypothetical protein